MSGGRPSKYNDKTCEKAMAYLDSFYPSEDDIPDTDSKVVDLTKQVIPSIAGLALELNVDRTTVYEWAKDEGKSEFSNILAKILSLQEVMCVNNGITGLFNSNIAKLVLGKHGYHEKIDNQHTGEGGGPVQTQVTFVGVSSNENK